eukprot:TRINITY_DN4795_c0_g1_i3.p1 TRINITY_DN4795_c0_g1~~TRINITY_DN4795_c0_g1_i3.p1  ORF type:complete len:166 (-),score=24.76 TRINITY_DN4795_c0_g1_i3:135-566(-)
MSPAYLTYLVLIITFFFLTLLLIPLPSFLERFVIFLLRTIHTSRIAWVPRFIVGFVMLSFVLSYTEMTKYSVVPDFPQAQMKQDFLLGKWRAERNFYLHCYTLYLIFITWGIQTLVHSIHLLEEQLSKQPPSGRPKDGKIEQD